MVDACTGTVFVFLSCSTADATRALDGPVPHNRYSPLTQDYMATVGRDNPTVRRMIGSLDEFSTRAPERYRRDRLSLTTVYASPNGIIHALKCNQTATGITYRNIDLDIELYRLRQGTLCDSIGFFQCKRHWFFSYTVDNMSRW